MLAGYCSLCDEQCVGWVELTDVVVGRSICISTTSPSIISVSSLQQEGERERERTNRYEQEHRHEEDATV